MNPQPSTAPSAASTAPELQADRRNVPVWILILLLLFIFWGMVYFDKHGGWFSKDIYSPYHSFTELERFQPFKGGDDELIANGRDLFSKTCAVCHMENGTGN